MSHHHHLPNNFTYFNCSNNFLARKRKENSQRGGLFAGGTGNFTPKLTSRTTPSPTEVFWVKEGTARELDGALCDTSEDRYRATKSSPICDRVRRYRPRVSGPSNLLSREERESGPPTFRFWFHDRLNPRPLPTKDQVFATEELDWSVPSSPLSRDNPETSFYG